MSTGHLKQLDDVVPVMSAGHLKPLKSSHKDFNPCRCHFDPNIGLIGIDAKMLELQNEDTSAASGLSLPYCFNPWSPARLQLMLPQSLGSAEKGGIKTGGGGCAKRSDTSEDDGFSSAFLFYY
jgi:hypothetical protein